MDYPQRRNVVNKIISALIISVAARGWIGFFKGI